MRNACDSSFQCNLSLTWLFTTKVLVLIGFFPLFLASVEVEWIICFCGRLPRRPGVALSLNCHVSRANLERCPSHSTPPQSFVLSLTGIVCLILLSALPSKVKGISDFCTSYQRGSTNSSPVSVMEPQE